MGIFSKLNLNFETEEVAKLRASTILEGRVDDRDLDRGLELGAQLDELQEDDGGREDGGVQERDAADFEDGGVGRGQGVRQQAREDGERHAANLEDVGGGEDEDVARRRFTFQGEFCVSGRSI